jgi:hypothetical protein
MLIIGSDLHTRYQIIARVDTETGEIVTPRLEHENGEAKSFNARLPAPVRAGIGGTGCTQWSERMLAKLGHELWAGDPVEMRARAVRRRPLGGRRPVFLTSLSRLGFLGGRPQASSHGMFFMPWVCNVASLEKPTAQNLCRGYQSGAPRRGAT